MNWNFEASVPLGSEKCFAVVVVVVVVVLLLLLLFFRIFISQNYSVREKSKEKKKLLKD